MRGFVEMLGRRRPSYSAVRQSELQEGASQAQTVYSPTTEPSIRRPTIAAFEGLFKNRFQSNASRRKWVLMTMLCGICAISISSLIVAIDPYQILFRMKVIFSEGGETFLMWKEPDIDLYLKVYLFNITNKEAFMRGDDEKLKVVEAGPYVYKESLAHGNVTFNDNGTMSAVPYHPLTYVPELSNGTEDDLLILPNIALLSFAQVLADTSAVARFGGNMLIRQTKAEPLVEMTAKEFMFGYTSTLVTLGNRFLPSWIKFDKLGLIDRMYDFDGDTSTTFTGTDDIRLSGLLDKYNGLPYLSQWQPPCNNITGASDGTKFNSLITKNQTLLFFRKSLCRSIQLVKVGEDMVNGLPGYRYHFKNNSMDNGAIDESNKCYLTDRHLTKGLLDVKSCYYGFPIALSYPHFYQADERLAEDIIGMNPDKEKHETYFIINDESGLPLNLSVKMQINMAFSDLSSMSSVKKFSNKVLPMLWTDITMSSLPPDMIRRFYLYLRVGPVAQTLAVYMLLVCGIAFILLSVASALIIPRLSLVSSQGGGGIRNQAPLLEPSHNQLKKRSPSKAEPSPTTAKEMELYYCSLLAAQQPLDDDDSPSPEGPAGV